MFVNQAVVSLVPLNRLAAHGLLGQTHRVSTRSTVTDIAGEVDDYAIQGNDILGVDFVFNRFRVESKDGDESF